MKNLVEHLQRHPVKLAYGVQIYLEPDGKFLAEHEGVVIRKNSLREVERALAKLTTGLAVFSFERFIVREFIFVDADERNGYRDKSGRKLNRFDTYYRATPALVAKLKDLERRYNEAMSKFQVERGRLLDNVMAITVDDVKNRGKAGHE